MSTRISVRQRYPDHNKPLRVLRTYDKYAQFEAEFTDSTRLGNSVDGVAKRVEELVYESSKTLDALKQKQPVRIPDVKCADKAGALSEKSTLLFPFRLDFAEETLQKPLKKHVFKRPGNFIRYIPHVDPSTDNRYNYEATQEDLLFLTELKGSPFTMVEFERLVDTFERENAEDELVRPFSSFQTKVDEVLMKRNAVGVEKIYDVIWPGKV